MVACKASGMIEYQSERLEFMVSSKELDDYPVTPHDLETAHIIFGPDLAGVWRKTARKASEHIIVYIAIPRDFMKLNIYVNLVADVMFVKNVAFLITMSRGIKFVMVEQMQSRTAKQLAKRLKRVMELYSQGSMIVKKNYLTWNSIRLLTDYQRTQWLIPPLQENTWLRLITKFVPPRSNAELLSASFLSGSYQS